jgi:prepilin-type processing-associated H-X9-DG protein/prepilin-type N-terminal cleavage/methylation domain-containing protein
MTRPSPQRRAFSLTELLIAIGIIAVLIALLLPVAQSVRRSARATACLANLQQWGHAYQMYLNGNGGRSFVIGDMPARADDGKNPPMWWELLQPYEAEAGQSLLCPEATEAANTVPKDAFQAWGPERFWDTPTKVRGPYVGSYGFNGWLYHRRPTDAGPLAAASIRLPAKESSRVPVVVDAARFDLYPEHTDPPALLRWPSVPGGMRWAALERHKDGVNALFLDGHAEHVPAPGLWNLKWSQTFEPQSVVIKK